MGGPEQPNKSPFAGLRWHPEPKAPKPGNEATDDTPLEYLEYPQKVHTFFQEKNLRTVHDLKNFNFNELSNRSGLKRRWRNDDMELWRCIHDFSFEHGIQLKYKEKEE